VRHEPVQGEPSESSLPTTSITALAYMLDTDLGKSVQRERAAEDEAPKGAAQVAVDLFFSHAGNMTCCLVASYCLALKMWFVHCCLCEGSNHRLNPEV
jgi:hypothetical protein